MKELFAAYVKAQAEIGGAVKDKTNPHFKSKYADLGAVVDAIKPVAAKHGLGYIQVFHEREHGVAIETVIIHENGDHYSTNPVFVPASKQDAQGYGSAITYARRYSLQTAFGVPSEDDDGNAAAASAPTLNQFSARGASLQGMKIDWKKIEKISIAVSGLMASQPEDWEWKVWEEVESLDNEDLIALAEKLSSSERATLKKLMVEQRKAQKAAA